MVLESPSTEPDPDTFPRLKPNYLVTAMIASFSANLSTRQPDRVILSSFARQLSG
jgi:hypothetical protein